MMAAVVLGQPIPRAAREALSGRNPAASPRCRPGRAQIVRHETSSLWLARWLASCHSVSSSRAARRRAGPRPPRQAMRFATGAGPIRGAARSSSIVGRFQAGPIDQVVLGHPGGEEGSHAPGHPSRDGSTARRCIAAHRPMPRPRARSVLLSTHKPCANPAARGNSTKVLWR